ncbi:Cell-cycle nuclear protein, contains WD-40 repeats [Plasmopara halstedii]|uniref:Cell-cycle nuclear protein, contains WD-40 repeats n=1 Tax=Plasmopara halstedii TaxID=4781 RepID=A0A0N7L4I4_PLAHL|nr:Cell-cycle nuclear protein, contains WD-40 repeats [Plasmopara halstedii]CEG38763.1 Cell-cycle nuclear protein, contains WD-40 repeats [Plasmopara halstedii]|eukprot:XP_024575132.1 Cell-cycle nuclear protein, contains WD-40 repeats [Plasmopara halstedii]
MESVDAALRYLQRQFASVASDEVQWNEERQKLQAQVRELEDQRSEQEQAYKDAMMRVKMLEFALRQERGRYLASPAEVSSTGGSSTKPYCESSEATRGLGATRSKSARIAEHPSPAPSPAGSPKTYSVIRADSRNKSGSITPKNSQGKGMEISRPRMMTRTASGRDAEREANKGASLREVEREMNRLASGTGREVEREMNRSASASGREVDRVERNIEPTKLLKPVVIANASKGSYRPHKLKLKLSGHMDGVRALAFHPTEPLLVSGSEDCTVKVWNLSSVANGPPSQRAIEVDSIVTMRTHTHSVLALAVLSADNSECPPGRVGTFVSAGRDGTLHLFQLPSTETDKPEPYTYQEYEGMKMDMVKDAHSDAIWDLHAHPLSNILFSAGADGIVRTWGVMSELTPQGELRCSSKINSNGTGPSIGSSLMPTSVHSMLTDPKTCIVGYTNGSIAQFDFAAERVIQLTRAIDVDTIGRRGQVNKLSVHPTMPVAIAAHQDRKIRMYDMRAGECVGSLTAHQDSVTSISVDAAGLYLASGGHDGSLRIWSVSDRHCVFEQSAHRPKMGEATHSVTYHPSRNFIATGGADSTIKIFQ